MVKALVFGTSIQHQVLALESELASLPAEIAQMKTSVMLMVALLSAACGSKQEVSFSTVEDARAQAKANATQNAQAFRSATGQPDCQIYARGDSTITNDCPNGDGWASIDLLCPAGTKKLKCSTVSFALNCLEENDFKGKPFAQDEGKCQPLNKVPHPLPKLTQ